MEQLRLLEVGQALVASRDPLAFQAIQAVGQAEQYTQGSYDPSDEAEVERITERSPSLGDLNGDEELHDVLFDLTGISSYRVAAD